MISEARKTDIIKDYQRDGKDTGSPEVQIAVLTARIAEVTEHLRTHRKDFASRRGLLQMVGRRNRLLRFLARTNRNSYQELIQRLGLRK